MRPTIGAPLFAPASSMNEAIGSPPAVVPPPIRMRVPAASRRRRRELRSFAPVADVPLISDSRAFFGARLDLCSSSHTGSLRDSRASDVAKRKRRQSSHHLRFHRRDFGHMDITSTIEDTGAYTKPWTFTQPLALLVDTDLIEDVCNENNRDIPHMKGK